MPVWSVPVGDAVYLRSAFGIDGGWYKWASIKGIGRVRVGDLESDVALILDTGEQVQQQVDDGFSSKYRNGGGALRTMITEPARSATLRLQPVG